MASQLLQRFALSIILYLLTLSVAYPSLNAYGESSLPPCDNDSADPSLDVCISTRGGGGSEGLIDRFLSKHIPALDNFHIHGWRWHTMSLAREAGRLERLAQRSGVDESKPLEEAADYVVGFNLKGLHRIEADLFFPWMREKLTAIQETDLSNAFATVMDQLEKDRKMVAKLGEMIKQSAGIASDTEKPDHIRAQAIDEIAQGSAALQDYVNSMMEIENDLLVPAIAQVVPETEQKSFNSKVLRNLGLLDSRLHLVSMHEAVLEASKKEQELFSKSIPSIPQMMIPRWKRNLYEPKTNVLDS